MDDLDLATMVRSLAEPQPALPAGRRVILAEVARARRRRRLVRGLTVAVGVGAVALSAALLPGGLSRLGPVSGPIPVVLQASPSPWGFGVAFETEFGRDQVLLSGTFTVDGRASTAEFYNNDAATDVDVAPRPMPVQAGDSIGVSARV